MGARGLIVESLWIFGITDDGDLGLIGLAAFQAYVIGFATLK